MKNQNRDFYELLREPKDERGKPLWTVGRIAAATYSSRAHVAQVLNNKPGRGGQTRRKLVRFFQERFATWPAILACLGWTETGQRRPNPKTDVELST